MKLPHPVMIRSKDVRGYAKVVISEYALSGNKRYLGLEMCRSGECVQVSFPPIRRMKLGKGDILVKGKAGVLKSLEKAGVLKDTGKKVTVGANVLTVARIARKYVPEIMESFEHAGYGKGAIRNGLDAGA